jgi:chemotaxis protein MotA
MAPKPSKQSPAKKPGRSIRPDLSTFIGVFIAIAGIIGGLVIEKGDIADIAQLTAALIVLGGTLGAVLVTTPLPAAIRAFKALKGILFEEAVGAKEMVAKLVYLSGEARRSGIVSLEREVSEIAEPFLRKAMSLAVDGAELQDLRRMMEVDIEVMEHKAEAEAKVWESAGGYAPTIGIIGAVLGLIQVMKHLEDIRIVGHGIAGAFVATVYGVGSANIFFLPIAAKLRARLREAVLLREMVLEGVTGIAQGLNPTLVRIKLESFVPPAPESKKKAKGAKDKPAEAAREKEAA